MHQALSETQMPQQTAISSIIVHHVHLHAYILMLAWHAICNLWQRLALQGDVLRNRPPLSFSSAAVDSVSSLVVHRHKFLCIFLMPAWHVRGPAAAVSNLEDKLSIFFMHILIISEASKLWPTANGHISCSLDFLIPSRIYLMLVASRTVVCSSG